MKESNHDMFFGSWYNLQDGSGIYAIVNSLDNKKYIGSTGTLRKRFRQHYAALVKGTHANCHLQRAVNKYGIDKFYFEEYPSVMDAARAVGNPKISRVGIKRCYQGRQKSAYGYIWKLKIQEND